MKTGWPRRGSRLRDRACGWPAQRRCAPSVDAHIVFVFERLKEGGDVLFRSLRRVPLDVRTPEQSERDQSEAESARDHAG